MTTRNGVSFTEDEYLDIKQKMTWNIYFIIYPKHQKKGGWMLTRHNIFYWQHNYFFKKNFNWNNYFELFDINCRYHFLCEIAQPLWIISKSIEFEICHMKLTTRLIRDQIMNLVSPSENNWKLFHLCDVYHELFHEYFMSYFT